MLRVEQVTGGYKRNKMANHNISFQIDKGEIVGLVGLNGAGKSTIIKHILGILKPTEGRVTLDGVSLRDDPSYFRPRISYIPEVPQLYQELTLWEHLEFTASAYKMKREKFELKAAELLKKFRMEKKINDYPQTFSKGMQQKVMILCAFLVEAVFFIIDEPFVGLDPLAIDTLIDLMVEMKQRGMGILVSTHILTMAEKYCDRVVFLHEGKVKVQGTIQEIQDQMKMNDVSLEEMFIGVVKN
ncbi:MULTISPECIES: ABC transporter ATP-binding protein [Bacillus]|uniref:ABC transporter ATP-binding protein n=1 Tax=Bacillus TaxID=1386 RepID=UPI0001CE3B6F|nr:MULTISPECIES: ABC transporter ATP-binding protein [Bacillus]AMK73712.1 multidrug ABC transporter ATP-binding protein [Bacillus subtilis subsp. natto]AOR99593.1 Energy-coupling factor transporter ATP-binding protein EcfA [Bacillus subtilis]AOS69348.1 multidrug ABC transporter ATP-binding protein [Bacillus subtilis]API43422.1 multidrug ABC transporter ATP-binding protein [Bacillus subtilis]API97464.1 multidrug ABC transporter ATP-binding protein [Bacillus subtilis]